MRTETVTASFAAALEQAEIDAWRDMYEAVPAGFAQRLGIDMVEVEGVVLTRSPAIPFVHFNCAMNLGIGTAATERVLDGVLRAYDGAGVKRPWIYQNPHCQPAALPQWIMARGLTERGGWDRIFCNDLKRAESDEAVEWVTVETARDWAAFIDKTYGLPTSPWLLALMHRPGWYHFALRGAGRIRAVRSMYVANGAAWLGVEAPVPGVMAPTFDLDARIVGRMIGHARDLGATLIVADIEAPSDAMDSPAYGHFAGLGFAKAYRRTLYSR